MEETDLNANASRKVGHDYGGKVQGSQSHSQFMGIYRSTLPPASEADELDRSGAEEPRVVSTTGPQLQLQSQPPQQSQSEAYTATSRPVRHKRASTACLMQTEVSNEFARNAGGGSSNNIDLNASYTPGVGVGAGAGNHHYLPLRNRFDASAKPARFRRLSYLPQPR